MYGIFLAERGGALRRVDGETIFGKSEAKLDLGQYLGLAAMVKVTKV